MELLTYLSADLAAVRTKLFASVVDLVPAERWTEQVDGGGSSITHLLLHLARHQDLAVQCAVLDRVPLFFDHREALCLDGTPPSVGLAEREDPAVAEAVDPGALIDYVAAVFDGSEHWLGRVANMALDSIPDTSRRLTNNADLPTDGLDWLHRMWAKRPVWWLAQWPMIGHGNGHVAEAVSVRNRMGLSPF